MPKLHTIAQAILNVLRVHPEGLDIHQIRELVGLGEFQQQFDRRLRELYPYYIIDRTHKGKRTIYTFIGERPPEDVYEFATINKKLRAKILDRDGSRCQMCGRTVSSDHVKLHIDHKIPQSWGGKTEEENLWALCSDCNEGKKAYYSSFDPKLMEQILGYDSVHERIAYLLKLKINEWVDSDLLEFVANFDDYQKDWMKRTRELRYLGLKIKVEKRREKRRMKSYYRLTEWVDLPPDPSGVTQKYEQERARRNRRAGNN